MKTFSDLLATNFSVNIDLVVAPTNVAPVKIFINDNCIYNDEMLRPTEFRYSVPLLSLVNICIEHQGISVTSLKFDGWEIRPAYDGIWENSRWTFKLNEPVYQWKHRATAQGWLLTPY
jgi:hypothetical protein